MKHIFTAFCLLSILVPASLEAQFHQKSSTGQTTTRQMNNPYGKMSPSSSGFKMPASPANRTVQGSNINVVGISPTAKKMAENMVSDKTGEHVKIDLTTMSFKDPDVWGRAENHPDGTYTQTIFDHEKKQADNLVIQETRKKSFNGDDPLVLVRKIVLNPMGSPEEVMIFDGAGRYKYHGKFLYDSMGRIVEEQLRDANGRPLRRTVQEYSASGEYLPLRSWDYADNIPSELQLVVQNKGENYREHLDEINKILEDSEKKGLFANRRKKNAEARARELQEEFSQRGAAPAAPAASPQIPEASASAAKETGERRFKLFRRRD